MIFFGEFVVIIYSIILHEIAHGVIANLLGDPTAKVSGRLTLNPIPHIDPLMTIAVPVFLYIIGSPYIFGGAKPVPVDPFNFRNPKRDLALTSLAGPLTNISLAVFASLFLKTGRYLFSSPTSLISFRMVLFYAIVVNIILGIFNLLPIPPLDGFKIVGGILPEPLSRFWFSLERFGFLFLIIALVFFGSIVNSILYPITNFVASLLI